MQFYNISFDCLHKQRRNLRHFSSTIWLGRFVFFFGWATHTHGVCVIFGWVLLSLPLSLSLALSFCFSVWFFDWLARVSPYLCLFFFIFPLFLYLLSFLHCTNPVSSCRICNISWFNSLFLFRCALLNFSLTLSDFLRAFSFLSPSRPVPPSIFFTSQATYT